MSQVPRELHQLSHPISIPITLAVEAGKFIRSRLRSSAALAAEDLFLRKKLALYEERQVKPRRSTDATAILILACQGFEVAN